MEMKRDATPEEILQVVATLAEKAEAVTKEAEELARQLRLARGTREFPRRAKRDTYVGDDGPTPELMDAVRKLITERPQSHQDLLLATGAGANRIKGVLMRIQREEGSRLANLGTEARALWFIPDEETLRRLKRLK